MAVDANNGKLKWYYQTVPNDEWDFDSVGGFIMADIQIEGKTRKVIMQAPKSGVFYILDRTNGQFISAEPFVPVNWVTGFDKKNNGKPIINQDAYYDQKNSVVIYPGGGGAHNWAPMSYNPNAGLGLSAVQRRKLQLHCRGGARSQGGRRRAWTGPRRARTKERLRCRSGAPTTWAAAGCKRAIRKRIRSSG